MRADLARDALAAVRDRATGPNRKFRIAAYNLVIQKLGALGRAELTDKRIASLDITAGMQAKLRSLKAPAHPNLKRRLTSVLGIGDAKADALIEAGLKNTSQLRSQKWLRMLSPDVRIMLKYKPLKRIPRKTIDAIRGRIAPSDELIVGSYRRGASASRDIDIMVVGPAAKFNKYITYLTMEFDGIVYVAGKDKVSMLIRLSKATYVKVDVFRAPKSERAPMLAYATGPKTFNIRMRAAAKKNGLLLNQKGLYRVGKRVPTKTEKALFAAVGMPWVEPHDRK